MLMRLVNEGNPSMGFNDDWNPCQSTRRIDRGVLWGVRIVSLLVFVGIIAAVVRGITK